MQLYTVRDALKADFDGTLQKVAAIGYKEVEFAGYMGRTPAEVKASLKQAGLTAPAEHVDLEVLEKNWGATVEAAHTVGHEYLIVAWIDAARRSSIEDYKRIAGIFNGLGRQANAAGLRFGYHNHAYEMAPLEGQVPYDVLLQHTDPDLVCFEMDLYWTTDGGKDPLAYFAKYPGRFPLVHVKDRTAGGQMVDVGAGSDRLGGDLRAPEGGRASSTNSSSTTSRATRSHRSRRATPTSGRCGSPMGEHGLTRREMLAASAGAIVLGSVPTAGAAAARNRALLPVAPRRPRSSSRCRTGPSSPFRSRSSLGSSRPSDSAPSTCCSPSSGRWWPRRGWSARWATQRRAGTSSPPGSTTRPTTPCCSANSRRRCRARRRPACRT